MERESPGHLWAVVQEWMDSMPYPPSQRQFSQRINVGVSTLTEYKYGRRMPPPEVVGRMAAEMRVPYERVLDAVLRDRGYREEVGTMRDMMGPPLYSVRYDENSHPAHTETPEGEA